jgi:polysaccharide deacetylase 2 family uncharacterized protein YibQ
MKKTVGGVSAVLRMLGINPAVAMLGLVLVLVCGILIGTFARNAARRPAPRLDAAKEPAHEATADEVEEPPLEKPREPIRPATDADTPFSTNALPFDDVPGPVASIIIDDMGVDMARSNRILRLDAPITVSYMPFAPNLQAQIDAARQHGKEAMLHIPMEAMSSAYANDYGPEYLKTAESRHTNVRLLQEMLARATGYVGINNHMGSKFTLDSGQMSGVMGELARQGLAFVDSKTAATSLEPIARQLKMPFIERDVFLDDSSAPEDIAARLGDLERTAKKRGWAIAIGHPREATIKALAEWLAKSETHGITVVPVSYAIMKFN